MDELRIEAHWKFKVIAQYNSVEFKNMTDIQVMVYRWSILSGWQSIAFGSVSS